MSLAGRPKAVAKKERDTAIAKARVAYKQQAEPIVERFRKRLDEELKPLREELDAAKRAANIEYLEAIGDADSARLLRGAA